jgi:cytochrome c-type biogenesis protein CcmH
VRARLLLAIAGAVFCLGNATADPADQLKNPAQEAHARILFREIRCVVCQSESIDESDADLAHDLRQRVRREVAAGASDDQVKADLVSRYGEFILLQPRFSFGNAALWLSPFIVVLLGAGIVLARRRPTTADAEDLSEPEKARLAALTDN